MLVPLRRKIRVQLLKWHRKIGLLVSIFVLVLVVSGIALNHGNELGLDSSPAPKAFLPLYGIETPNAESGFKVDNAWVLELQNGLYLNSAVVDECSPELVGAIYFDELILAVCQNAIYLLTKDGQMVEKDTELVDLIKRVGIYNNGVIFEGVTGYYGFDTDEFKWNKLEESMGQASIRWAVLEPLPQSIAKAISQSVVISEITWERVMQDLHSGRLFGQWGVWLMDLAGIAILMLALSGVWLRVSRPSRK